MKKVLIIQWIIKQYRLPFYIALAEKLRGDGICLKVAYGKPVDHELEKYDNVILPKSIGYHVNNYWLIKNTILYQPVFINAMMSDLVIVEQANKHIINYPLLILNLLRLKKVALWGHGRNRQSSSHNIGEKLKKLLAHWTKYWFAYTNGTANYLLKIGINSSNIHVVNNSTDTHAFQTELEQVTNEEIIEWKYSMGIGKDDKIGLYCGSLYTDKKLSFLIEAAEFLAKVKGINFHLIVLGDGPERTLFEKTKTAMPWLHYLGPLFGKNKAIVFRAADVFLNPGLLGLAVLDAFSAKLPVITTDIPIHSPEIEYLKHGYNGMVTEFNKIKYATQIQELFDNINLLNELSENAWQSAQHYTIERMVECFRQGIIKCLK